MAISQTIRKCHALPPHDLTIALRASFDIATPTWFVSLRRIATAKGSPTPPAHDSVSSQPAVDFHAELNRKSRLRYCGIRP
jgi:hypothetical protein